MMATTMSGALSQVDVKVWRSLGLRVIVYIDGGICAVGSHSKCLQYKELVVSDLGKAGFVLNITTFLV